MTDTHTPDPFPGSQSLELDPILTAILTDLQGRNIKEINPQITNPTFDDPGQAYALSVYERGVRMTLHRIDDTGQLEIWFGDGGQQYGPVRWYGTIVAPSDETALLSLMAVQWISMSLGKLDLKSWSLKRFNRYYTDVVGKEEYRNILRVFALRVLKIPEFSFEDGVDVVTDSSEDVA